MRFFYKKLMIHMNVNFILYCDRILIVYKTTYFCGIDISWYLTVHIHVHCIISDLSKLPVLRPARSPRTKWDKSLSHCLYININYFLSTDFTIINNVKLALVFIERFRYRKVPCHVVNHEWMWQNFIILCASPLYRFSMSYRPLSRPWCWHCW